MPTDDDYCGESYGEEDGCRLDSWDHECALRAGHFDDHECHCGVTW